MKIILFFCFLASLSSYSFKSFANVCDCKKIRKTGECNNPNCAQICDFQLSLNEINRGLVEKCLKKEKWDFGLNKKKVSAASIESITQQVQKRIEEIQKEGEKRIQDNCPNCQLIPEISALFKVNPPKKNCPEPYLKTHKYENSKIFDLKNKVCDEVQVFKYFEKYVRHVVSGDSEISKKLWKDCPDPCSFQVNYTVKIDEKKCDGEIDLKVGCTHKVEKGLFGIPIYDMNFRYTGDLKCESN